MRKVSLYIAASLDGSIARRDGSVDWLPTDQDYGYADFIGRTDTVILGRKTYEAARQLMPGNPFPGKRTVVFSRTHTARRDKYAEFVGGDIVKFIRELREQPGQTIWLAGGANIVRTCLTTGVVDEIILSLPPLLLGDGVPLFLRRAVSTPLTLRNCHSFPGGLVQLAYDVQAA